MTASGIVLCGGGSTRMGRDKGRLPVGDETMLARVVRLVGGVATDLVIVAREGQEVAAPPKGVPHGTESPPARVVRDPVCGLGPLAGIVTGLKAIVNPRAFVTACDMPLLRPAIIERLLDLAGNHEVCVPVWEGHLISMCAVYRVSVVAEAERLISSGERSVRGLIDRVDAQRVDAADLRDVDPELESFFSCDTPERYARVLRMVGGRD